MHLFLGSWACFVSMEQWSYFKFDVTRPICNIAIDFPCSGEKYKKPLESACAQLDLECEKDVDGYGPRNFLGMPT